MTTPPTFPTLAGQGWSVHKKPVFSTIVAQHVSGREVRDALYANPIWNFELTFDGLDGTASGQYGGLGASSYQTLLGFFLARQGQFANFLFVDPSDSIVSNGAIATGDGATTAFTFYRGMASQFYEPVGWVTGVAGVYFNGALQSSSIYSVTEPNTLTFTTAPGAGVIITASFSFAFLCRFDGDDLDFEQFMSNLWRVQSLKFRSLRAQ